MTKRSRGRGQGGAIDPNSVRTRLLPRLRRSAAIVATLGFVALNGRLCAAKPLPLDEQESLTCAAPGADSNRRGCRTQTVGRLDWGVRPIEATLQSGRSPEVCRSLRLAPRYRVLSLRIPTGGRWLLSLRADVSTGPLARAFGGEITWGERILAKGRFIQEADGYFATHDQLLWFNPGADAKPHWTVVVRNLVGVSLMPSLLARIEGSDAQVGLAYAQRWSGAPQLSLRTSLIAGPGFVMRSGSAVTVRPTIAVLLEFRVE